MVILTLYWDVIINQLLKLIIKCDLIFLMQKYCDSMIGHFVWIVNLELSSAAANKFFLDEHWLNYFLIWTCYLPCNPQGISCKKCLPC